MSPPPERLRQLEDLLRDAVTCGDAELLVIVLVDLYHEFPSENKNARLAAQSDPGISVTNNA